MFVFKLIIFALIIPCYFVLFYFGEKLRKMYYLTPLCFICLKSKSDLTILNTEILTELIYCIDKTENFIPSIANDTKICKDCLNKLSTAFHFKKMYIKNIVQFKDYVDQLERAYVPLEVVKKLEQYSNEEIPLECSDDTKFPKQFADDDFKLLQHKEEILDGKCDKSFPKKQRLIQRVRNSSKNKLFSCDKCLKKFQTNSALKSHKLIHADPLLFSCSICKKKFAQRTSLNYHNLTHSGERPHSCPICKKTFMYVYNLNRHKLIHLTVKPHTCSICKKSFTCKWILNQHKLIHANVKPHTCSICMKSFTYKCSLRTHSFVHTNELPYSCPICEKSYRSARSLKKHKLIHAN